MLQLSSRRNLACTASRFRPTPRIAPRGTVHQYGPLAMHRRIQGYVHTQLLRLQDVDLCPRLAHTTIVSVLQAGLALPLHLRYSSSLLTPFLLFHPPRPHPFNHPYLIQGLTAPRVSSEPSTLHFSLVAAMATISNGSSSSSNSGLVIGIVVVVVGAVCIPMAIVKAASTSRVPRVDPEGHANPRPSGYASDDLRPVSRKNSVRFDRVCNYTAR